MQPGQASQTAEYMAFYRALESVRPKRRRLFTDPFAAGFLRPSLRRAVWLSKLPVLGAAVPRYADRRRPGARSSAVARTRIIDDALQQALADDIKQVVILGAGFDCRAYRLPQMDAAQIFEVDHPATLAVKRHRLTQVLGDLDSSVRYVAIDFDKQSLPQVLLEGGFDPLRRAVFLWEGVTNYLSSDAIDSVLRYVSTCAPGSRLVFTYVHRGALDASTLFEDAASVLRDVARMGEPWTFGIEPSELENLLKERGLRLERDVGARKYRAELLGPRARGLRGYDFYHVAVASVP